MLENYLNSQDEKVRMNAAKAVYDRLEEDESRRNDKALTDILTGNRYTEKITVEPYR